MREASGQISTDQVLVREKSPSPRLRRFVEEKVRGWLNASDLAENTQVDYKVSFFNSNASSEVRIPEINCLITIKSGTQSWKGWEAAPTAQLAFIRSLKSLQINPEH